MNLAEWFSYQLEAGGDGFIWAVEQIPPERLWIAPPPRFGLWPAARQAYHVFNYDTNLALPEMRQWLGAPTPSPAHRSAWEHEDDDWQRWNVNDVLARLQKARAEQSALLNEFGNGLWDEERDTIWGLVTLKWAVSKTVQHTAEHACTVMQMALFWDRVVARQ